MKTIKLKNSYLLVWLILSFISIGISAQTTYIPDDNFRQVLIDDYNVRLSGPEDHVLTADIETITDLSIERKSIVNLDGIQDFTALEELDVNENNINSLNLSQNLSLRLINCEDNGLTSLILGSNTQLQSLYASDNALTGLDVSANTGLITLEVRDNQLSTLDVNFNTALEILYVGNNNLRELLLDTNTSLTMLDCNHNSISALDLTENINLRILSCANNGLSELKPSLFPELRMLDCAENNLTKLDLSSNNLLTQVFCSYNSLINLNIQNGNNSSIANFFAGNNPNLECIQVDDVTNIPGTWQKDAHTRYSLECEGYTNIPDYEFRNALITDHGAIAGPHNSVLTSSINTIEDLDLFYNDDDPEEGDIESPIFNLKGIEDMTALVDVDFSGNFVSGVNLSNNEALEIIQAADNDLTVLNLENNRALTALHVQRNNIIELNLENNNALQSLFCGENNLHTLNIQNGNNTNLLSFSANLNPNLECVQVDDPTAIPNSWTVDPGVTFSLDCSAPISYTYIEDDVFRNYLITEKGVRAGPDDSVVTEDIEVITDLVINDMGITSLVGIEDFTALTYLSCAGNNLSSLDVSQNTELTFVNCARNNINSLNFTQNTELIFLYVGVNALTYLNIKNGNIDDLAELRAFENPNLNCIEVDDVIIANRKLDSRRWIIDNHTNFSTDCDATVSIPDPNFETALREQGYDDGTTNDGSVPLRLVESVTTLNVSNKNIASLVGIESFTSLTLLNCSDNNLTALDVSNNSNLTNLDCSTNTNLASLQLSTTPSITRLACYETTLGTLNIDNQTELTQLYCNNAGLTALNVINNTKLTELTCSINNISSLNLDNNTSLVSLYCASNSIGSLDLSRSPELTIVQVASNSLTELNIKNGNNNGLAILGALNNPDLQCIQVDDTTTIPSRWQKDLHTRYDTDCSIRSTYVPDGTFWHVLIETYGAVPSTPSHVLTSSIENINYLNLAYYGEDDRDPIWDLTGVEDIIALTELFCNGNEITTIDLSNNLLLVDLDLRGNNLTELHLENNSALTELDCDSNNLSILNIKNGNNSNITSLFATNNPNLGCIQVDNETADILDTWHKDPHTRYSTNCDDIDLGVFVPDDNLERHLKSLGHDGDPSDPTLDDYVFAENLATIDVLNINNKNISSLVGIENLTGLTRLEASNNNISDITPLADLTQLTDIYIDNNNLSGNLDFTGNTELVWLRCYTNYNITGLNLSANTKLKRLQAATNSITDIDLSNNLELIRLHLGNNNLNSLDVHLNTELTQINCQSNNLTSLNLQNGNNRNIHREEFDARNNPSLTCIQVDNPLDVFRLLRWGLKKDRSARFRISCSSSLKANNTKEFKANNTLHVSTNNTQDLNYVLYPNPVTNTLHIKSNSPIEAIHVMNMQGAKILTTTKTSIDFSNLASGIYILNIISGNRSTYKRIIKQ